MSPTPAMISYVSFLWHVKQVCVFVYCMYMVIKTSERMQGFACQAAAAHSHLQYCTICIVQRPTDQVHHVILVKAVDSICCLLESLISNLLRLSAGGSVCWEAQQLQDGMSQTCNNQIRLKLVTVTDCPFRPVQCS